MSTSRPRLRRKLLALVLAFSAALALTYAYVVPALVVTTEDRVFEKQLAVWVDLASAAVLESSIAGPLELGPGVVAYRSREDLPAQWLGALEPGIHEFNDVALAGLDFRECFVVVESASDAAPGFWLIYDVSPYEAFEAPWSATYFLAIVGGTAAALLAAAVGLGLWNQLRQGLRELEQVVATSALDDAPGRLPAEDRDDEVGAMARLWRGGQTRTRAALRREQDFARNASHELRTPLAAARGAIEQLEDPGELDAKRRRELAARAKRALESAGNLVSTFLWLAREELPREPEPWPLAQAIEELLGLASAARTAAIEVRADLDPAVEVDVAEAVARAVLAPLIANAFQHGHRELTVTLRADALILANDRDPDRSSATTSFGFGLEIVAELAARLEWRVAYDASQANRFTAHVALVPPARERPPADPV